MFVEYNPNPADLNTGDCVVRAITKALGYDWECVYIGLCLQAFMMADMPSSNRVWIEYLADHGFRRYNLPDTCPDCYTVEQFARDHQTGTYIIGTGTHVVAVVDGDYYDSWDSGQQVPIYFFRRES